MQRALIVLIISLCTLTVCSQEVTVSADISLRDKEAYDIVGKVGESIILFNHKGKEQFITIYDENLVQQSERQVNLVGKRPLIYEVINLDTAFAVIYGYHDKESEIIQLDVFSATAELKDSVIISERTEDWLGLDFETMLSEDESFLAFYQINGSEEFYLMTYDIAGAKVYQDADFQFGGLDLYDSFVNAEISNNGDFYFLIELNNSKSRRDKHEAVIYHFPLINQEVKQIVVPLRDVVCRDIAISVDNTNGQIGLVGLYDEKRLTESEGFVWMAGRKGEYNNLAVQFIPFSQDLIFEVYGSRSEKRLKDFAVADVIWKQDGTPILVFEMQLDIARRSAGAYGTYVDRRNSALGGWSDHYREDLVLVSLNSEAEIDWHRVFYKRQFSQNDNGIFSSFYPFLTPQRLRLIYNDEIKSNSTVSEYILDPLGNYKRTSVLSTEYQNLKLRFADAEQISSTELLIPSQRNYTLNVVKIDFGR